MHWNILADKLAHGTFEKVPKDYVKWEYRFELIKQHINNVNPDAIGLSEVDVEPIYNQIQSFMNKLGYDDYFVPKPNNISGSAIFWKRDKLACLTKNYQLFGDKSSQFFMFCVFAKKNDTKSINSSIVPSSGTSYQDNRM